MFCELKYIVKNIKIRPALNTICIWFKLSAYSKVILVQ